MGFLFFFYTWQQMHKIFKAGERNMTHLSLKSLASRGIFTLFPALASVEIQKVTLSKLEITLKIYPDSKKDRQVQPFAACCSSKSAT